MADEQQSSLSSSNSASFFNFLAGSAQAFFILQSGKAQKRQAEFNAAQAITDSIETLKWSRYNEDRERSKNEYNRGQMVVDLLKNGVSIDEGTTADAILLDQEIEDEMSALSIRRSGQVASRQLRQKAFLFREKGKTALSLSKLQATATILASAGKSFQINRQGG